MPIYKDYGIRTLAIHTDDGDWHPMAHLYEWVGGLYQVTRMLDWPEQRERSVEAAREAAARLAIAAIDAGEIGAKLQ